MNVLISGRFNGPLASGNGGYAAGVVAGLVDGPADVSLRRPVPLAKSLAVVRENDGSVRVLDGDHAPMLSQPARLATLLLDQLLR